MARPRRRRPAPAALTRKSARSSGAGAGGRVEALGGLDAAVLNELLGFHLRRAQQKLFLHFRESIGRYSVTPGQVGVLVLIRNNPAISQAALARAIGVERATLGQTITYLERHGWVRRRPAANDRRSYALALSSAGRTFLDRLIPVIHTHERDVAGNLSAAERRELLRLLMRF